jgi:V8-like Glu-specific endopeptidase
MSRPNHLSRLGTPSCWARLVGLPAVCGVLFAVSSCAEAQAPRLHAPNPQQAPWTAAIGQLDVGNAAQHCSAVLIGSDTIVTAAHCLFLGSSQVPASPYEVAFHPNLGALPALPPSRGVVFKGVGGIIRGGKLHDADVGRDWAVIAISPPVVGVQPLPVAALPISGMLQLVASGDRLVTAGYGNDSYDELRLHAPCRIVPQSEIGMSDENGMLITDCSFRIGDAGGPILLIDGAGQPALVGIISGFGRNPRTAAPLGLGVNAGNFAGYLRQPIQQSKRSGARPMGSDG